MYMVVPVIKNNVAPLAGNVGTWLATLLSYQSAQATLTLIATAFSITVSLVTLLWIAKQWRDKNRDYKATKPDGEPKE